MSNREQNDILTQCNTFMVIHLADVITYIRYFTLEQSLRMTNGLTDTYVNRSTLLAKNRRADKSNLLSGSVHLLKVSISSST